MGDTTWNGLVVVVGASWWNGTPLAEHHIAEELTAYAPVLYVDPPTSVLTRFRNVSARDAAQEPGLRVLSDRLAVLSVRVPPLMERPVVKDLALAVLRRAILRATRRLGATDIAALVIPTLEPLFGAARERTGVLYLKDDYVAGAELAGVPAGRLERMSERLPREADVVVVVSEVLADRVRGASVEPVVIPNGVDPTTFARTPAPPCDGPRRAAFVGHLSERIDAGLLLAVVDAGVPDDDRAPSGDDGGGPPRGPCRQPRRAVDGSGAPRRVGGGPGGRYDLPPPVLHDRIQPGELAPEAPRVSRCRPSGREHRPPRRPCARVGPGHARRRAGRLRRGRHHLTRSTAVPGSRWSNDAPSLPGAPGPAVPPPWPEC